MSAIEAVDVTVAGAKEAGNPDLSPLWQPLDIGSVRVKNRVMISAHSLGYSVGNLMGQQSLDYYRERARGGVGLILAESQAVHRSSKGSLFGTQEGWRVESVPIFRAVADALHEQDCRFFVQLGHFGAEDHNTMFLDNYRALLSASPVPSVIFGEMPKEMETADFDALIDGYATTAANAKFAEADGVEVHAAHGHLLLNFLSPMTNHRTDRYGGDTEGRCRFVVEIAQAIRDRCGPDFTAGFRYSLDEFVPGGIDEAEGERILRVLHATGLFDYLSISGGNYHTMHRAISPMSEGAGQLVPLAARAKEIVGDLPIFTANGHIDLHQAAGIVRTGKADMVIMTRAHIADAWLVNKGRTGRESEIRHCVGCNQGCIGRAFRNEAITCTINPVTGREATWGEGSLVKTTEPRRVVVVGGGPAGMKAAAVAAARGHQVTLLERTDTLGGQVRFAMVLPTRSRWGVMIDDLERMLRMRGVEVRLGVEATEAMIAAEAPDDVVLATGSSYTTTGYSIALPFRPGIPGLDHIAALTPTEAIADPERCGSRVLIVDDNGDYLALGLAEYLIDRGATVEIVSRHLFVGEHVMTTLDVGHLYPRLYGKGVRLSPQTFVQEVGAGGETVLARLWDGVGETRTFDSVVLNMTRLPIDALYEQLNARTSTWTLQRIGDCLAARAIDEAIYEGENIGRLL